jgi:hypothetical protein
MDPLCSFGKEDTLHAQKTATFRKSTVCLNLDIDLH